MKKTILVVGNCADEGDCAAFMLVQQIKTSFPNLSFIHWDPTEELPLTDSSNIILIDTVSGIQKVSCFTDLEKFALSQRNTVHDFDLAVGLKLLQKLGKISSLQIIGIPYGNASFEMQTQLRLILQSI